MASVAIRSGGILIEAGAQFGGIIATVWEQRNETQQADADLIKSSPKLLGVLQFLAAQWAEEFDRDLPISGAELVEWFSEVRKLHILPAIAEARGIKAKVAKPRAPTAVQMRSIREFAARNGRDWKPKLLNVWFNGKYDWDRDDSANLQQVRNTLGPDWLATFELPEAFAIVQSSATGTGITAPRSPAPESAWRQTRSRAAISRPTTRSPLRSATTRSRGTRRSPPIRRSHESRDRSH